MSVAIHVDHPVAGELFDPTGFRVRGWCWLGEQHPALAAVEAYDGNTLLGEAPVSTLAERPDVNAKHTLASGTKTGFEFSARHPTARPHETFTLSLRARLRDGTPTPELFTRVLAAPAPERHPFRMLCSLVNEDAVGVEIGAHVNPTAGLAPFYTDVVAEYAGTPCRADFLADARALPLPDDTLDYLCSSHVLEHLADPIAALHEWHRVLKPGGVLYLVVPDKRFTFDEPRLTTTVDHLLRDFHEGTSIDDTIGHVDEFVFQTNWSILNPHVTAGEQAAHQAAARAHYLRQLEQGLAIDIHYHTFTPESLDAMLRAAGFLRGSAPRFELLSYGERYPPGRDDGIGLLLRKTGPGELRTRPPATFKLCRARDGGQAQILPLVCPVSLRPLQEKSDGRGTLQLVETDSGREYPFASARPTLFPPPAARVERAWQSLATASAVRRRHVTSFAAASSETMRANIDEPARGSSVDPLHLPIAGWAWLGSLHPVVAAIEAWSGDVLIGETSALFSRPDVEAAHALSSGARTGFEIFAHHPSIAASASFPLQIFARLRDGTRSRELCCTTVTAIARDYRGNHFGVLLDQRTTAIQRRSNIFAAGPPPSDPNYEVALLLRRYLGEPPSRILEVGCGVGAYGRGLRADGYDWLGVESDAACCTQLAQQSLPHQQADATTLPFPGTAFDAALCLDRLHTLDDPRALLAELRRVAPRRLIVTVPNCELLGYLWDHLATPWHMLGAMHVNFFTRWSLGSLLREYYPRVEVRGYTPYPLRTIEGTPLYYNLMAVASSDT